MNLKNEFKQVNNILSIKYLCGFIVVLLFIGTVITLPRVDSAEPNVFFYLQKLTPLYYVCLFFSLSVALYFKRGAVSLISAIVFALLLLWTPVLMLVQFWPMDTFPFLSQAVYVTRTGYSTTDVLGETPGMGMFVGAFISLTGLDPFLVATLYPAFFTIIFVTFLYLIGKEIGLTKAPVLAPLLSVAIMWPNEIHLSRQCFSLIFYVAAWFLFLKLMKKKDSRYFGLLAFLIFLLVISHPVSSLFFMTSLAAIAVLGTILRKIKSNDYRLIFNTLVFTGISWVVWNAYALQTSKGLDVMVQLSQSFINAISRSPTEISGISRILTGYTSTYSAVINTRLAITILIGLSAIVFSFIIYRYNKDKRNVNLTLSWFAPGFISAVALLYVGLPYMARPALFFFISWAPLGAWIYQRIDQKQLKRMKIVFVIAFIVIPALLLPIIKYAPLPFTFATTKELSATNFVVTYYNGSRYVYMEASPPYGYSFVAYGSRNTSKTITLSGWYSEGEGLYEDVIGKHPTLVVYRILTRDAFWDYNPTMAEMVDNMTLNERQLNKVYDSGWPYYVFVPDVTW